MFTNAFFIDITPEEVKKRVNGRRIDPQTEITYHVDYNPPPEDN